MSLADKVIGFFQNLLGMKSPAAVMRDATYIRANRYDSRLAKPLQGQDMQQFRKWQSAWQNMELSDLHGFPLWEKGVHDVLHESFSDLCSIFAYYSKSVGGSVTAEDAVTMTMTEFKNIVKDTGMETRDLRWDAIGSMFMKANALNNASAHAQRVEGRRASAVKHEGSPGHSGGGRHRSRDANAIREDVVDKELVLYEFLSVLVRISFWRANPFLGIIKLQGTVTPLPDCLQVKMHELYPSTPAPLPGIDPSALRSCCYVMSCCRPRAVTTRRSSETRWRRIGERRMCYQSTMVNSARGLTNAHSPCS